jgi:UDP-N-acetylglucosamine 1-carboxyvinyltransferase
MNNQQIDANRLRIGLLIANLRQEKGLTQGQLADDTGISQANISRMEKGKYNVSIDLLSSILYALDHQIEFSEISLTEKMLEK